MGDVDLDNLGERVLSGGVIGGEEAVSIAELPIDRVIELVGWADRIRRKFRGNRIHLCAIQNIKCGGCGEDCAFCSQSARYATATQPFGLLGADDVVQAAREAQHIHATALGIVAAWRGVRPGRLLDDVCQLISALARSGHVEAHASLGIIESAQVAHRLREAGLRVYNHNLETARSFFPQICTTHSYDDRVATVRHLKAAGLGVCCGGLMGMGETPRQRAELAMEIRGLDVDVVPLNFLHRIPGTPLENMTPLTPLEILKTIALFRFALPQKEIVIAGGRDVNLRDLQAMAVPAGATGMIIGNYLTTPGRNAERDLQMFRDLGMTF